MVIPPARLIKLLHRLTDADDAEAQAAFSRLRSYCRTHQIKLTDYQLVPLGDNRDATLNRYLAAIDRLWDGDPRLVALQRENEQLRQKIQRRKRRRTDIKVERPLQEMLDG